MKIIVLGNQARAMSNYWSVLIRRLAACGHDVLCLTPAPAPGDDPIWEELLQSIGGRIAHYPLDRKGLNPFRDARTLFALRSVLARERPDILFAYSIKPVIYGALAAALAGQPRKARRFFMITGLGYMFEGGSSGKRLLTQIARLLYRIAFANAGGVFFQNQDDRELFDKLSITPRSLPVHMSKGTGVDTDRFAVTPMPQGETPFFLFVGRLIEAKGLRELAEAIRLLQARHPDARVRLLGPLEQGLGGVPMEEIRAWEREGLVEYLGESNDVRPVVARASVVVLPSWREGTPCSLMEAMSMGRAVIAADAPGSREVLRHEENGLLVPVRDPRALALAMERFYAEPDLAGRMGRAGRALMESSFSAAQVAEHVALAMGVFLEHRPGSG